MTIRVFIASSPDGVDAEADLICEHAIRSLTKEPVEITFMRLTRDRNSPWYSNPQKNEGWNTSNWVTCFSGLRWGIPAACNYQGMAIYMDNDVLALDDLGKLNSIPLAPGKILAAKSAKRFCVMLMDCARCKPFLPSLAALQWGNTKPTIKKHPEVIQIFTEDQNWNCLDGDDGLPVEKMKALHFTSINTQPWIPMTIKRLAQEGRKHWFDGQIAKHPRQELTKIALNIYADAIVEGYKIENYIPEEHFGPIPKRSLTNYKGIHR